MKLPTLAGDKTKLDGERITNVTLFEDANGQPYFCCSVDGGPSIVLVCTPTLRAWFIASRVPFNTVLIGKVAKLDVTPQEADLPPGLEQSLVGWKP